MMTSAVRIVSGAARAVLRHTRISFVPAAIAVVIAVMPCGEGHANGWDLDAPSPKASGLHGRLWDGLTRKPIADGYVFVLDADRENMLGNAQTLAARGSDSGFWQVTGLPATGHVWIVAFHSAAPEALAIKEARLTGAYQEVPDLTTQAAQPEVLSDANIYALLGTVAREANRVLGERAASKIAALLVNRVPAAPTRTVTKRITPTTLGDYPGATRIGDDQKVEDYYVCRHLRTKASLPRVREWYIKQAAARQLPLVSEESPNRAAIKENRYGIHSDPFGRQVVLTFVCESQEEADSQRPQILIQITEDRRPKYGPTRITYRFWGPPRKEE